jgi:hypothetical protein
MNASQQGCHEDPLVERLKTVQNNYVLGLASIALLTAESSQAQLRSDKAVFGGFAVEFAQIADLMRVAGHRDDAVKSFLIMLMCSLVKDTFELVKHHSKKRRIADALKAQGWYQYARLVRNCIGHNFILEFKKEDLAAMPIRWRQSELTAAMNGQQLPLERFGYAEAWQLFLDMKQFAGDNEL